LSDFQITIPEVATIKAVEPPIVVVTSNRTREIHDALKRRCIYHWIDYPDFEREVAILRRKAPGVSEALARELGVEDRVRFLGNVPHERIPLLVRAADVFVLNSEYEGLSHTLLEVQALGTPMVASGVCGNPEVVEDGVNGLLVDPSDHEGLAAAMGRILGEPGLAERFVSAGHAREERFDRGRTFSRVEALLAEAAGLR